MTNTKRMKEKKKTLLTNYGDYGICREGTVFTVLALTGWPSGQPVNPEVLKNRKRKV